MAKKKKTGASYNVTYQSQAEARTIIGRIAYLAELDPKYCDVIVNRYARITGNINGYYIRDGQQIPYAQLKQQNALRTIANRN